MLSVASYENPRLEPKYSLCTSTCTYWRILFYTPTTNTIFFDVEREREGFRTPGQVCKELHHQPTVQPAAHSGPETVPQMLVCHVPIRVVNPPHRIPAQQHYRWKQGRPERKIVITILLQHPHWSSHFKLLSIECMALCSSMEAATLCISTCKEGSLREEEWTSPLSLFNKERTKLLFSGQAHNAQTDHTK